VGVGTPVTTILRGRVTDENGEPLPAAQISVLGTALGTLTNAQGDFSLRLGATDSVVGSVTVTAERLGFSPTTKQFADLGADTVLAEFRLEPTNLALQGIVATGLVDPVSDSRVGRAEVVGAPSVTLRAPSPAETWSETTRTDAEGRAGFELLLVPELEVLHIEVGESGGAVVVRIQQALATEGVLTLLERRVVSDPDTNAAGVDGSETLSMRRGDVMITASGPLAADSLRALLEQVR
jgi:hypothetical protein